MCACVCVSAIMCDFASIVDIHIYICVCVSVCVCTCVCVRA